MIRSVKNLGTLVAAAALLAACTAIHTPSPYLPSRSGIVPGETITVPPNQNIYALARAHNVPMRDVIVLNDLHAPFALKPGQQLVLPANNGSMPSPYGGAPITSAASLAPAPIASSSGGVVEQAPISPILGGAVQSEQLAPPPTAPKTAVEVLNTPTPQPKQIPTTIGMPKTQVTPTTTPEEAAPIETSSVHMVWPVKGPVVSGYGPKGQGLNNDGVNISAPKGAPVVAAAGGTVVYAGNEMKGFGNLVLIRHPDGWVTAYAHLDRVLVTKDVVVAQGDMIGTVGKTGDAPSPQLHFETRHDGKPVDPNGVIKG